MKLRQALSDNKIKTITTHAVISSSEILIRDIIIPKVAPEEIKSVVHYQIADYLPVSVEDYEVQYLNQGSTFEDGVEKIKILLLAIPKYMVVSHLELLRSVGLKPKVLDYQGNAMTKLLDFNNVLNKDYPLKDLTVASIDIGYNNSKIIITKNGEMEIARIIDFGSKELYNNIASFFDYSEEKAEKELMKIKSLNNLQDDFSEEARFANIVRSSITDFCEKVNTVFRHHRTREVGNALDLILLQGGLANTIEVDDIFATYFNIPAMQLSNLDMVRWDGNISKYANAIGGLIRTDVK